MSNLLETVKQAGEDFEWYPTTRAMLEVVAADIKDEFEAHYHDDSRTFSILDIGAGNGSALKIICELTKNTGQKYAIEKSKTLIDSLPEDVFIVGTDFNQQTLIDKKVDVVFCNPPYSDYEAWMRKVVSEANGRLIYLVVPQRWKENGYVMDMINRRCDLQEPDDDGDDDDDPAWRIRMRYESRRSRGACKVLESMSFEDSEFRRARAQVDIIKIKFKDKGYHNSDLDVDPFDLWFETTFSINADKRSDYERDLGNGKTAKESLHDLVMGRNVIECLEELYQADLAKLFDTYKAMEKIGANLLKELGVNLDQVKEGLKSKISGLKNLYWAELFGNLDTITNRLTSKSRKSLLDKLTAHTSIDFTADNAYAVVVWAIKNANHYFDEQLREVYMSLANQENIRNYKSNKRVITDDWRYAREEQTHYTLDYRLVLNRWHCFGGYEYDHPNGLAREVHDNLNDLCTIAKNLGFNVTSNSLNMTWTPGGRNEFFLADGRLFMDVRAFKKGTIHVRCDQAFMRRLNVEAARLNGWVKSPAEAREETGIDDAAELYGTNFKLKSIRLLSPGVAGDQLSMF